MEEGQGIDSRKKVRCNTPVSQATSTGHGGVVVAGDRAVTLILQHCRQAPAAANHMMLQAAKASLAASKKLGRPLAQELSDAQLKQER